MVATILNTGAPQGCVCFSSLNILLIHSFASRHNSHHIIKYADDSTVVGLI